MAFCSTSPRGALLQYTGDYIMKSGSPPRIVFLDRETLSPQTRLREPSFPHRLDVFGKTAPAEVAQRIADADIVITNKAPRARRRAGGARDLCAW